MQIVELRMHLFMDFFLVPDTLKKHILEQIQLIGRLSLVSAKKVSCEA